MLKKLVAVSAVLFLISCQSKVKEGSGMEEVKIEDGNAPSIYQTVDNDAQANALNQQTQDSIQEIEVQDRVFFGYDSAELSDEAKQILDNQAAWLKSDTGLKVTIEGHCDERGTREYNIALGEKRANAVKNYLAGNGISDTRMKTISYGKERPAFFGSSEGIFTKNRRAVTVVN